jgi:hypothetical protein
MAPRRHHGDAGRANACRHPPAFDWECDVGTIGRMAGDNTACSTRQGGSDRLRDLAVVVAGRAIRALKRGGDTVDVPLRVLVPLNRHPPRRSRPAGDARPFGEVIALDAAPSRRRAAAE